MAYSRGYHSYRGRGSKGRTVLIVLLVAVILVSIAVMLLSRHIVYDETGTPRLELPWQAEAPEEAPPAREPELTIQETPEEAAKPQSRLFAFTVPTGELTAAVWQAACDAAGAEAYNAAAVTLKDDSGRVYFDSTAAVTGSVKLAEDTADALAAINGDRGLHTIARLSCFHDPKAANSDVEGKGLKNTGGYIFYDGNNSQWLDPAKPAAREYLCQLAKEAAELGFDEILLTDVSYPTVGKLNKIAYGEGEKSAHLTAFLQELRAALETYSVALSIELPEAVITQGGDSDAGLVLAEVAPLVDRVYAVTAPERVSSLSAAVTDAAPATDFVPELTAYSGETGCLVLS